MAGQDIWRWGFGGADRPRQPRRLQRQSQSLWSSDTVVRDDINGDGRSDIGAWYDFSAGTDATYTFFGQGDNGALSAPFKSYAAPAGEWDANS